MTWQSFMQRCRLLICPFEPLLSAMPDQRSVLDIGCGTGSLLLAAFKAGKVREALGVDVSEAALSQARVAAAEQVGESALLQFQRCDSPTEIRGLWECVVMVDVLHHVPVSLQESFWKAAARCVSAGGRFIYKDMCHRPLWRVLLNRLHDLVVARQWIHEVPMETVRGWALDEGFKVVSESHYSRWWYGHELLVLEKSS